MIRACRADGGIARRPGALLMDRTGDRRSATVLSPVGASLVARRDAVGRLPFFADAPVDVQIRLDDIARWYTYDAGALVFDFDDETSDVYFIVEGTVRVLARAPNGKERLLGEIGEGQFFGEMSAIDDSGRSANVTAIERTRVCILRGADFIEAIYASPVTCRRLLRMMSERIRAANARLLEDAALPGRLRLASELLRMSTVETGSTLRLIRPLPLEHDLAARIGVRREAVSRAIAELLRRRHIARRSDALVLLAPDALRQAIDEHLEDAQSFVSTPIESKPIPTSRPDIGKSNPQ